MDNDSDQDTLQEKVVNLPMAPWVGSCEDLASETTEHPDMCFSS